MAYTILNLANCAVQGNTGPTPCNSEPGIIRYLVFVPKGTVIPHTAMASQTAFTTYVLGRLRHDNPALRWQITPKLYGFKDNTEQPKTQDQDGTKVLTQMPPYNWEYSFANGTTGATKNIHQIFRQRIHQQQNLYSVFAIDENNLWIGQATGTNVQPTLTAADLSSIIVGDWGQATTSTANSYKLMIALNDNSQLNAFFGSVASTTLASSLTGLTDVTLFAGVTSSTSTHIYVSGRIGGASLGARYGTVLDDALTAFVITDTTNTAKTFTISAVSYDAANDQWDITGAWSTSNTGDTVTVALAAPSVMIATPYFAPIVTEGTNIYTMTAP